MPALNMARVVRTDRNSKKAGFSQKGTFMSLIIYLIGFAFVIGGIAWALVVAGVSSLYVMIVVVILIGVAILTGVTRTRTRD
jgi:apolipoprotein N-acyltransferase